MYIWQQRSWPVFHFDSAQVDLGLERVLVIQKRLTGKAAELPANLDQHAELDAMVQSVIKTSEIEGESLNAESVRSSVVRHLGLEQAGLPEPARHEASVVQMLVSALSDLNKPLTIKMLCDWQAALFPEPPLLREIAVGEFRNDAKGPMHVVSERQGKIWVHFEAPPAEQLLEELKNFLLFYNSATKESHGIVRAAIAHLLFITVHPFDDGNGRVARALTDRALAQSESSSIRFYSLSSSIEKNKKGYYQILEDTQNCRTKSQEGQTLEITEWLLWFLQTLEQAMEEGLLRVDRVLLKARFWQTHAQTVLTERQIKVLNRLLDSYGLDFIDGLAARHYQSIVGVSKATATRDLYELVEKGCLKPSGGGGRSSKYVIKHDV